MKTVPLKDIATVSTGIHMRRLAPATGKFAAQHDEGREFISVTTLSHKAIKGGSFNVEGFKTTEADKNAPSLRNAQVGDIIIKFSAPFDCAAVTEEIAQSYPHLVVPAYFGIIRLSDEAFVPRYVAAWLNSASVNEYLRTAAKGSRRISIINKAIIESVLVPCVDYRTQENLKGIIDNIHIKLDLLRQYTALEHELLESVLVETAKGVGDE